MKRAVGISLGSSKRDKKVVVNLNGVEIQVERIGTDGDVEKARQMYLELDGKVDAFGIGGVEFFLQVEGKKYYFRDVKRIRDAIKVSKVGDGCGVKGLLEKRAFEYLEKYRNEKENRSASVPPAPDPCQPAIPHWPVLIVVPAAVLL